MITPRESFKQSDFAKGWQSLVDSKQFEAAAHAAMLQMQLDNSAPPEMATAASYAWRNEGAKQFLRILMGLTAPVPQRQVQPGANLNHGV